MVTTTPLEFSQRSLAQRMDALAHANRIRCRRAVYKRDLKAGRKDLIDALLDPPAWLQTAKVFDLLLAVPKVGRVKANTIVRRVQMPPSKTIGGLSQRQRTELVVALRGGAPYADRHGRLRP